MPRHLNAFVALAIAGCGTQAAPRPAAAPPPARPPAVVAPPPPVSAWSVSAPTSAQSYLVESTAIVSARADTLARTDSIETRTALRVVPRGAAVDVTISAYDVRSANGVLQALRTPSRAVGRYSDAGAVTFEGPGKMNCATPAHAAFESTRDLWVRWPGVVRVGSEWLDSTTIELCRDGIPLRMGLLRAYRVTAVDGDSGSAVLSIQRTSRATISGQGALRGDSVAITGEGSGSALLRMSTSTGWMIDADGRSSMKLEARGQRRTQTVDQTTVFRVRTAPDSAR